MASVDSCLENGTLERIWFYTRTDDLAKHYTNYFLPRFRNIVYLPEETVAEKPGRFEAVRGMTERMKGGGGCVVIAANLDALGHKSGERAERLRLIRDALPHPGFFFLADEIFNNEDILAAILVTEEENRAALDEMIRTAEAAAGPSRGAGTRDGGGAGTSGEDDAGKGAGTGAQGFFSRLFRRGRQ